MPRSIKTNKFGLAENPVGYQVIMPMGHPFKLADVIGVEKTERPGGTFGMNVVCRSFNREHIVSVPAFAVKVIDWETPVTFIGEKHDG